MLCEYCDRGYNGGVAGLVVAYDHLPDLTLTTPFGGIYSAVFSPDGEFIATGSTDNGVRLWSSFDGRLKAVCKDEIGREDHTDWIRDVQFSTGS